MTQENQIDKSLIIIGSGPAGCSAAIYAARANINPVLIAGIQAGGQLTITTDVENYPGIDSIQGPDLMQNMISHAKKFNTEIDYDDVIDIKTHNKKFLLYTRNKKIYHAKAVIVATGAQAKWLNMPSELKFQGYGVSGCAVCDGFFFKNKDVAVVGGGNSAVEEALYLSNHARNVTLIHRRDSLRAEKILQDRLFKNPKINILWNHVVDEIVGNEEPKFVTGVRVKNVLSHKLSMLDLKGIFIAIGHQPNTKLFKHLLDIDEEGYIITHPGSTRTSIEGVFAAGDVQDKIYRQAVTAAGTGCMAALDAEKYISQL